MTYNIRKEFLGENSGFRYGQFNPALDEPTYLTFKLDFFSDEVNTNLSFLYDSLPQALFSVGSQAPSYADNKNTIDLWDPDLTDVGSFIEGFTNKASFTPEGFSTDRPYSALEYLYSRNEDYRCYLLAKFLKGWNDLQTKYQYYFQEIDGLDELFKSDPSKGQKIEKSHTITIKCLEGIDQKVKYLLSLYKAAAWDDHYQRWILPDIYRYFKLDIYISEIRTFHQSIYSQADLDPNGLHSTSFAPDLYSNGGSMAQAIDRFAGKIVDKITGKVFTTLDKWTEGGIHSNIKEDNFVLGLVKGFVPVTCLRCSLCDFDINYNPYQSSYSINNDQMETTTIKIKVRQAEEIHNWRMIEPYRNLLNNTERQFGQQSLKAIVKIGDLADQYFNDAINLSEDDKAHYYTTSIGSGWIVSGIQKIADTVLSKDNGILDKVYDTYEAVRDAIAQKRSTKENYDGSSATRDLTLDDYARDFGTTAVSGTGKNSKMLSKSVIAEEESRVDTGTKKISPYGSTFAVNAFHSIAANDPSTYSYLVALSHQFELDPSFNGIVWTRGKSMMHPNSVDDLSLSTDLDSSMNTNLAFEYNRSQMQRTSSLGSSSLATSSSMTPLAQNTESLLKSIENGTMTFGALTEYISSNKRLEEPKLVSFSQINDNSIQEIQDLGLSGKDIEALETNDNGMYSFNSPKDRSIATDLDFKKDILLSNLISGHSLNSFIVSSSQSPSLSLTSLNQDQESPAIKGDLVSIILDNEFSSSTSATSLIIKNPIVEDFEASYGLIPMQSMISDDIVQEPFENLYSLVQDIDRSLATDLDNDIYWKGQKYGEIDAISNLQKQLDRSLSTDLDNNIEDFKQILPQYMIEPTDDRSLATELDGLPNTNTIEANATSLKLVQDDKSEQLTSDELRNSMVWVEQSTTSLFNNIAGLQSQPQDTVHDHDDKIDTRLVEIDNEQKPMIEEDLFSKIANNLSAATSVDKIETQEFRGNDTSSVATGYRISQVENDNVDDIPVRELIKVLLIDRSKKEDKIQEIKIVDNSTPKTIIL